MYSVALLISTLFALTGARIYERCELAHDLQKLGVNKDHISTWVCIAFHESRFDTAARNHHSGDHGLLQISELYWCGFGKACGQPCSALRDDDISDDVQCALKIYEEHTRLQGNGFLAWVVYPHHCKHNTKKYLVDCDSSVKDTHYKIEDKTRSSNPYKWDSTVNITQLEILQSVPYMPKDQSLPPYLTIISSLRGKYDMEFERGYSPIEGVSWVDFKIENVDELMLPDLNQKPNYDFLNSLITETSSTSTTPELILRYQPVKPWRTIESNQFRRRMMIYNKQPTPNLVNKPTYENVLSKTTPISKFSSTPFTTTFNLSTEVEKTKTEQKIYEDEDTYQKSKNALSSTHVPPESFPPLTTKNVGNGITHTEIPIIDKSSVPVTQITNKPWSSYKHWNNEEITTSTANILSDTRQNNLSNTKLNIEQKKETQTPKNYLYSNKYNPNLIVTTPSPLRKWKTTVLSQAFTDQTSSSPKPWTWRTIKSLETLPAGYNQNYSQTKISTIETKTTRPLTMSVRWGKSWSNNNKNVSLDLTSTMNNETKAPDNIVRNSFSSRTITELSTQSLLTSTKAPFVSANTLSEKTTAFTIKPTTRTTQSIFDFYLNPTKRPKLPTYMFNFSNNNASKLKIFSGGTTTSAPFLSNESIKPSTSFTQNEIAEKSYV